MTTQKQSSQLTVRILGRDYSVACPEDERESLLASAEYVSKRMSTIQKKGRTMGMERIAVMAALNIARDLLAMEREQQSDPMAADIGDRLDQLQLRIESTLDETR